MERYPCGNGWFGYDKAPVYERPDGLRVHLIGIMRLPDGGTFTLEQKYINRFMRIKGGNRKRALMALATWLKPAPP